MLFTLLVLSLCDSVSVCHLPKLFLQLPFDLLTFISITATASNFFSVPSSPCVDADNNPVPVQCLSCNNEPDIVQCYIYATYEECDTDVCTQLHLNYQSFIHIITDNMFLCTRLAPTHRQKLVYEGLKKIGLLKYQTGF